MTEQEKKEYLRKHVCPKCLEKAKAKNPNMLDCIYRENNDEHLCEYAQLKAYLFWYVFDYISERTEYIYVIATTMKQACYFWDKYLRENVGKVYQRAQEPCNEIFEQDFIHDHKIGEVLGMFAVI